MVDGSVAADAVGALKKTPATATATAETARRAPPRPAKHKARALYRVEAGWEAEAEKVTGQIVGKVIRQNRQAEAAAERAAA
ncbi:hypothetical protein ACFV2N_17900 [Streptomyces sp. NPDC059680]|uniref:hypothetical protein n=1 Tax=Streptomyces sp. NPDC059680 TaxID=3346904 RepID=UPI0036825599